MNQSERRIFLIKELLSEDERYRDIEIPRDERGQRDLLRSLMNVRMPEAISEEFLKIQDEYLSEERDKAGVVEAELLPTVSSDSRISLWQGDITTLKADAIVNAANSALLGCFHPLHSCIDNIIHSKSGIQLRLCCNEIMSSQGFEEPTGEAKITPGYNLPAKYVLHTVGPIVGDRVTDKDRELLASCYRSCLELAEKNGCKSIAFCCISTGVFHFPNQEAAQIAVKTVKDYIEENKTEIKVIFNVFKEIDYEIYRGLLGEDK